jgi:hypothetical protein
MSSGKGSLLEKLIMAAVAALYVAVVAYMVFSVLRRVQSELRAARGRKRPNPLALAGTLRRLIK